MNFGRTLLRVLPLFALLVFGCKEDEVVPEVITLNGDPFTVATAAILGVSLDTEGHASISLINVNGTSTETLMISVEYSGNSSVVGTYSFPQADSDKYLDDFLTTFSVIDGISYGNATHLSEGSVTVKDNGNDNYTIEMDLLMDDGSAFKGTYTGAFTVVFNNG